LRNHSQAHPLQAVHPVPKQPAQAVIDIVVNDLDALTMTACHCEQSEAISIDCHVAALLAMTTFFWR